MAKPVGEIIPPALLPAYDPATLLIPLAPLPICSNAYTGEKRLWAAVLMDAIQDACRGSIKNALQALCWLIYEGTRIGDARWICELLDLDHDMICNLLLGGRVLRDARINRRIVDSRRRRLIAPITYLPEKVEVACRVCRGEFIAHKYNGKLRASLCPSCRYTARRNGARRSLRLRG